MAGKCVCHRHGYQPKRGKESEETQICEIKKMSQFICIMLIIPVALGGSMYIFYIKYHKYALIM